MTVNVSHLQQAMKNLLNPREQIEFIELTNDFHARRNLQDFAYSLKILLDTPAKQQLCSIIRSVIPRKDVPLFDSMMALEQPGTSASLPRPTTSHRHNEDADWTPGARTDSPVTAGVYPSQQAPATRYYQTLPSRGARLHRASIGGAGGGGGVAPSHAHVKPANRFQLPSWGAGAPVEVKHIVMELPPGGGKKTLGFSIRGGAEHGIGIYVSYVDISSVAERHGLRPGDHILGVNGVSFQRIPHDQAAQVIKHASRLDLEVRNVGRVPGSFETHQTYTWVDPLGRVVPPPPEVDRVGRYDAAAISRKSALMLLKDSDERKVNISVSDNKPLGLMIRGGNEYGLGIYITGVDRGLLADDAGLKVGDQILDVNGHSFLDISHENGVKTLKSSKLLMLTIKDVGRLPYARTTVDQTQWIPHNQLPDRAQSAQPTVSLNGQTFRKNDSVFSKGAGSQLVHQSLFTQPAVASQWGMLDEQARQLLNPDEQDTMTYYLTQYQDGHINVKQVVLALMQLLNTHAKFCLMTEVRGLISAKDIEVYDSMVLEKEMQVYQSRQQNEDITSKKSPPQEKVSLPNGHAHNNGIHGNSNRSNSNQVDTSTVNDGDNLDALKIAIEQISADTKARDTSKHHSKFQPIKSYPQHSRDLHVQHVTSTIQTNKNPAIQTRDAYVKARDIYATPHKQKQGHRGGWENSVTAQVHVEADMEAQSNPLYEEMRSPSEDSGVELNGNHVFGVGQSESGSSMSNGGVSKPGMYNSISLPSITAEDEGIPDHQERPYVGGMDKSRPRPSPARRKRVTMSPSEPVIINDAITPQTSGRHLMAEVAHPGGDSPISRSASPLSHSMEIQTQILEFDAEAGSQGASSGSASPMQAGSPSGGVWTTPHKPSAHDQNSTHERSKMHGNTRLRVKSPENSRDQTTRLRVSSPDSRAQQERRMSNVSPSYDSVIEPVTSKSVLSAHSHISDTFVQTNRYSNSSTESFNPLGPGMHLPNVPKSSATIQVQAEVHEPSSTSHNHINSGIHHAQPDVLHRNSRRASGMVRLPDAVSPEHLVHHDLYPGSREDEAYSNSWQELGQLRYGTGFDHTPNGGINGGGDYNEVIGNEQFEDPALADYFADDSDTGSAMETVTIYKTKPTLGVAIEGGANSKKPLPRVLNIQPGGSASESGGLRIGHILLQVDGQSLEGLAHNDVARAIAKAFKDKSKHQMELVVMEPNSVHT